MSNTTPILQLRGVSKRYLGADQSALPILRDVHLTVRPGETHAIMGPSGSGKSTLLNLIGTLDQPDQGSVELEGRELTKLDEKALAQIRRERLGFIFQSHHLLPQCTVLENVLVPTLADRPHSTAAEVDRARHLLDQVGLSSRLLHRPGQLSGGERQRVAVVRALINQPALLLADEPTGALDRQAAEALTCLLAELNEKLGLTLIVVTHAATLAHRMKHIWELRDGMLEAAN